MNSVVAVLLYILVVSFPNLSKAQLPDIDIIKSTKGDIAIEPIFHGAIVLKMGSKTIYVDPYNGIDAYEKIPMPDLILITHFHHDHLDTNTLNAINTSKAKLIAPKEVVNRLSSKWKDKAIVLANDSIYDAYGISIKAVPMYDLPQEKTSRHLKGEGNGYVIEFGGKSIYISGDTDDIQEMRNLKNIDVAFVCMNEPYTMTIEQATSAVLDFMPKIVYPYHFRNMNGFTDIEAFKKIIQKNTNKIEVRIRNWYKQTTIKEEKNIENVTYGMVSGASLTMDIYKPKKSNQIGIIVIPGSAFGYAYTSNYNQLSMTDIFSIDTGYFAKYAKMLVSKGFTIFVINHRLAPQFRYSEILADCQRAVRYVRYNSQKYGINPKKLGAFGYSSGGTLCAMLGVKNINDNLTEKELDTVSSNVQAVVTLAARFDLSDFNKREDSIIQNPIISRVLLNYIGELPQVENGNYVLSGKYAEASPITYVDKLDAPFLIYQSDNDPLVPKRQALRMHETLIKKGIDTRLKISKNELHNPIPNVDEIDDWFLKYLK